MPQPLTYPGVYIEEIPSGVRTISGVATSVAAFVGWAPEGATDRAVLVQSWEDYAREFGGLHRDSYLGYSVLQFFNNGGREAYIVRLVADDAGAATLTVDGKLVFTARSPGNWATKWGVAIRPRADDATRFGIDFMVKENAIAQPAVVRSFEDLSMVSADRRFVEKVINTEPVKLKVALVPGANAVPAGSGFQALAAAGDLNGTVLKPNAADFETKLNADGVQPGTGVRLLDKVDLFNLLCVPGEVTGTEIQKLQKYCRDRRAFLIVDCAASADFNSLQNGPTGLAGADAMNSALYFPWVNAADPLRENREEMFPPCGFVAGMYAKTDAMRGVWKAPAGTEAGLSGAFGLTQVLTDMQNGRLNVQAVNCLRNFSVYGNIVWGARTLHGNNEMGSEWKYVPVRRMALFIEESLFRGTKWVVFEPNDEPLWAQIRLNIGAFMHNLFRQGAFAGMTPREAYFVKCDKETTNQQDVNLGIVNIVVGFAPLKPAEYVVVKLQQIAGQIAT